MAEPLTGPPPFGEPSQAVLPNRVARLSEARFFYKAKRLELEHQFEAKMAQLHEEYLAVILQIRESPEQWELRCNERSHACEKKDKGNGHAIGGGAKYCS